MRVILTIAGLVPEFGGPSRSVPALAEELGRQGVGIEVISCEAEPGQGAPMVPNSSLARTTLIPARSRHGRWLASRNDFFVKVRERVRAVGRAVIHDNALWLPTNHAVARAAISLKLPLIISPRGMLSAWATRHHGWKKRVAWALFQHRDLASAAALHATSEAEAVEFRHAGLRQPIAIIPNGVNVSAETQVRSHNDTDSPDRTALFLSRIHPKKGLLDLVEAWARVRPANWKMVVAGNDEGGHREEVEAAVRRHNLAAVFSFLGAVKDEAKWNLYREADLFILPSYSENFGIVVAEALACGVPVITTRGTPWRNLIDHRAGWWVENGIEPITEALLQATRAADDTRREMGARGRKLVLRDYSWPSAAGQMKSVYEWLLNGGEAPGCVK